MEATLEPAVLEDQAVESPEPIAPDTAPVETPAEQPPPEDNSDIEDFLQTAGLAAPEAGSDGETEPDDRRAALLQKVPEDVRGEVEELLAEREQVQELQRTQRTETQRLRFKQRIDSITPFLIERGVSAEDAQRIVGLFNAQNSDGLEIARSEATQPFITNLLEEGAKLLPASQREGFKAQKFKSGSEFAKSLVTEARKGYVTEKQAKEQAQETLKGYKKYLIDKKLLASVRSPEVSLGGGSTLTQSAEDAILADPNSDIKIVNQILARRSGQ